VATWQDGSPGLPPGRRGARPAS